MRVTREVLIGATGLALGLFLVGVWLSHHYQRTRELEFTQQNLLPIAAWVETYRKANDGLPTEWEFREWADSEYENKLIEYYSEQPKFVNTWGVVGHDFVIGMWQGDWVHYYQSWDGKDFAQ